MRSILVIRNPIALLLARVRFEPRQRSLTRPVRVRREPICSVPPEHAITRLQCGL